MACKDRRPKTEDRRGGRRAVLLFALVFSTFFGLQSSILGLNQDPIIEPTAGLVITHSARIKPAVYRLPASGEAPVIIVRGSNITVDFQGATLEGGDPEADPDTYAGVGVLIDGGSNVTVKNATIRGYKVGILARRSADLHVTRNDLSYNWKQQLYSGIEKESFVDWMSYHQNERDEWLRYGAAI